MEHQLIIPHGTSPDHPMDDQIRVMAQTNVGPFEDEGFPDLISGTLSDVPDQLRRMMRSGEEVFADICGRTYRFTKLSAHGAFELRRVQ